VLEDSNEGDAMAMSERRRAVLYAAAFAAFVFVAASPYGEAVESVLVYPGIAVILLLSIAVLFVRSGNPNRGAPKKEDSHWWNRMQDLLRFPW
jgi:hypothetical protein